MRTEDWEIDGTMAKAKRDAVAAALVKCRFDIRAAARQLRVSRSTAYRLIEAYRIEIPDLTARTRPMGHGSEECPVRRVVLLNGSYQLVRDTGDDPSGSRLDRAAA